MKTETDNKHRAEKRRDARNVLNIVVDSFTFGVSKRIFNGKTAGANDISLLIFCRPFEGYQYLESECHYSDTHRVSVLQRQHRWRKNSTDFARWRRRCPASAIRTFSWKLSRVKSSSSRSPMRSKIAPCSMLSTQ